MKNQGREIIEIPINAEEEKVFQWVESEKCLGSWMPGEQASVSEKTKYEFSQVICRYLIKNNLSEEELAQKLDLDKDNTARLVRGYTESFSLDSLINYVEKLHLPLQIKVSVASGLGSSF
ncbi:XRE family transcriptional regulator [endosymbiont GvMRE of Glomus versiforme]|uniref:XRE family transcriptional regulator n=1 Tax=endosymbiont GvMRE of Glomus versiforme TaxID=2039283 RepID=UPI000EE14D3D|nr:XRE family transcriptional regulator [endosymbiont GvMRE of Glomus versiforme]RHZ36500.1 hypothetical protein GvMRE_I2g213 [endosymbiont GvMRE of Glomus versiforme]